MKLSKLIKAFATFLTISTITACEVSTSSNALEEGPVGDLGLVEQELQGQVGSFSGKFLYGHLIEEEDFDGNMVLEVHLFAEQIETCNPTEWARVETPSIVAHLYEGFNHAYEGRSASLNIVGNGATDGTLIPSNVYLLIGGIENGMLSGGLAIRQDVAGTNVNLNGYFAVIDCRNQ